MKKKIKVFCRISSNADCGVGWYRQVLPLLELERQGCIELKIKHFTWGVHQDPEQRKAIDVSEAEHQQLFAWCDVALFSRNDTPHYIAYLAMGVDFFKKPVILDYDDCVWHTRPVNPGYRTFHPNSDYLKWNLEACKYVSGLSTSTEFLKNEYKDRVKDIFVLPNSLDMEERDKINKLDLSTAKLYNKKEGEFRIIWSGSASHYENLKLVMPALRDIMTNHPHVTFYYTGLFGDLFQDFPKEAQQRIVPVPFVDLRKYGRMLREMHGDIAIAPLTDCNFNRAKSNLRVLEYGSVGYPVVASDVDPYQIFGPKEVVLVKAEGWYHAIENLMFDKKKRLSLGKNLYKRVKKDFNIKKNCKLWLQMFRSQMKKMK